MVEPETNQAQDSSSTRTARVRLSEEMTLREWWDAYARPTEGEYSISVPLLKNRHVYQLEGNVLAFREFGKVDYSQWKLVDIQAAFNDYENQGAITWRLKSLKRSRGMRYADCTLSNFVVGNEDHAKTVKALRNYCDQIPMVRRPLREEDVYGNPVRIEPVVLSNVLLTGPSGTGKDHLMMGLMVNAILRGLTVKWTSGSAIWSTFRDAIGTDEAERELMGDYLRPDVLAISDPKPVVGSLTPYQADTIYRIVDARYNDRKAVWATINAVDASEAIAAIGAAVVDRLRDGALSLACNWPSYRQSRSH